jgi:sensor histidine kinase YesM
MKQYVSQTVQHENQFLNIGSSNYLDWQLALVVPVRVVYREMYQVFLTIALFSILIIVLSMIFFQIVIRRITHPIMALVRQMSDVDIDTLDQEFAIDSRSFEAGVLSKSFQQMTQRLRESINDQNRLRDIQVKTNFDALQSQIGPHFLFNSLGSIAYMCENGQSSSAADACYSLTDILRYSANYQQPIVTLKDESELLRSYLYLMKMRYQHRINYSIQIDDQLLTLNLPRLTLQPLVENAIKYGLAEIETVQIKVMAHLSESVVRLTVSDNGAGFSALSIDQINARYLEMMRDTKDVDRCKISFGRMGLLGTLVRLSLFFGQSFDYQIEINADRGASVHLFLPFTGQPMSPDSEKGA